MPRRRPQAVAAGFVTEAQDAISALQLAVATLLASFRGPLRPSDLSRRLGIHQTLAWKVLRLANSHDLFSDVQYIPGTDGFDIFLSAAEQCGTPPALVLNARQAATAFHEFIRIHAGDRASLEQLLGGVAEDQRMQADSRPFRKAGYRCACSLLGVKAGVRLLSKILHPGAQADMMDIALIRGFINMRRIRPGVPIPLARVVVLDNDGHARRDPEAAAIDPQGEHSGVPLLRPFCSSPLPEIRIGLGPDGTPEHQLGDTPIGDAAAITLYSGEVRTNAARRFQDQHNLVSNTAVSIRLPMERLTIDLWAHRALGFNPAPSGLLFGELCGTPWYRQIARHADRLPMAERPQSLGYGLSRARISDAHDYVEVMRFSFARLNWNPDEFALYRLSMEYPMVGTAMVLQLPLPPPSDNPAAANPGDDMAMI